MPASAVSIWTTIADEAAGESKLWAAALVDPDQREEVAVFSPLAQARFALGLESIYEAYLLHYGRPRLFAPPDRDTAVLLGDYLYAHGLVRIAEHRDVEVVAVLAELISRCAHLRAEGRDGDGAAWVSAVAALGDGDVDPDAVARALALHESRLT